MESGFGNTFGFYLVNGQGATFYSEDSRNPGGFAENAEDVVPFRVGQGGARGQGSEVRSR